jgi:hypothetical protein
MRIDKVAGGISGYSFVDEEVEAEAEEEAPVPTQSAFVEDEEDEEVAPAPVPQKSVATVKKVLKKVAKA